MKDRTTNIPQTVGSISVSCHINDHTPYSVERCNRADDGYDTIDLITEDGVVTIFIDENARLELLEALKEESNCDR